MSELARVIQSYVKETAEELNPPPLDYGEIMANRGLKLDGFPLVIPVGDYTVCESAGEVAPGNRVLAAWVGGDVCVISRI